jgi:amino acid transporter
MPTTQAERHSDGSSHEPKDPMESIVKAIPLVLPLMAGVLMFLLAFIAIYMA